MKRGHGEGDGGLSWMPQGAAAAGMRRNIQRPMKTSSCKALEPLLQPPGFLNPANPHYAKLKISKACGRAWPSLS